VVVVVYGEVVVDGFVLCAVVDVVVVGVDAVVVVVVVLVVVERATVVLLAVVVVVVDMCTRSCDALVGGCSVSSHQLRRKLCPATILHYNTVHTHLRWSVDALTL
jgi:hypothetical protein